MKIPLATILFLFSSNCLLAQKPKSQIEINPYIRMDGFPQFSYAINSSNTYFVNIKGTSWGINANYKLPLNKKLFVKAGLGYYRYSFDKIDSYNTQFGKGDARIINYPNLAVYILFATNKYWYNCFSFNLGIEKQFDISKKVIIISGIDLSNFYTYSQYYRITADYPTGPPNHSYKVTNSRYFGILASAHVGVLKKFGKVTIGPNLILPIYDIWMQDKIFPQSPTSIESNSSERNKWFRGIGFGITLNYSL